MRTEIKIPDIKPIDKGRVCIEPAPQKYKKVVILTFTSIGICLICLLVQGAQYLLTKGNYNKTQLASEVAVRKTTEYNNIIKENDELVSFYESTQRWMSANTFFCEFLS